MNFMWLFYRKIPLLCVFAGETAKLAFFFELKKFDSVANLFESTIMVLSLFFVPAIGLFSDKNCRKKTLVTCMCVGLASLIILVKQGFLASILNGLIGAAVVPIARAMYLDVTADPKKNWGTSLAIVETVVVQAAAWTVSSLYVGPNFIYVTVAVFVLCILMLIPLKDKRDFDGGRPSHEISSVRKRYLEGYSWQILIAFLLYDCAFQLPNYFSEAFSSHEQFNKILGIIGAGILIGSAIIWAIIRLFHSRLSTASRARDGLYKGLIITSTGMFLAYFLPFFQTKFSKFPATNEQTFFYFCCVSGMLLALTFVYFGNMVRTHERGLMLCILEEIETLAETVVPIFVLYLPSRKILTNFPFLIIIGLGLMCLLRYPKKRKISKVSRWVKND